MFEIFNLTANFSDLSTFIIGHGYLILFILMLIEGPIVTLIAAFAASFGFFDIWIIVVLSLLGNIIPDVLYFSIGRVMRKKSIESFILRFGLKKSSILKLEKNLKNHTKKAVVFIKLTPFVPIPGIMLAGFLKLPYRKFFSTSILIDIGAITLYSIVGYYAGITANSIANYFKWGPYALLVIAISILLAFYAVKRIYFFASEKIRGIQ
jgi:membrane protein DedA with SNARE-associated domain